LGQHVVHTMWPIATSVARSVVCASVYWAYQVSYAKTAELLRCLFGKLTHMGPRNHVLDGVKIGWFNLQLQGVTRSWCSLLRNYFGLWYLSEFAIQNVVFAL